MTRRVTNCSPSSVPPRESLIGHWECSQQCVWLFLTASLPEVGGAWERPELSGADSGGARTKEREGGGGGGEEPLIGLEEQPGA